MVNWMADCENCKKKTNHQVRMVNGARKWVCMECGK